MFGHFTILCMKGLRFLQQLQQITFNDLAKRGPTKPNMIDTILIKQS